MHGFGVGPPCLLAGCDRQSLAGVIGSPKGDRAHAVSLIGINLFRPAVYRSLLADKLDPRPSPIDLMTELKQPVDKLAETPLVLVQSDDVFKPKVKACHATRLLGKSKF